MDGGKAGVGFLSVLHPWSSQRFCPKPERWLGSMEGREGLVLQEDRWKLGGEEDFFCSHAGTGELEG